VLSVAVDLPDEKIPNGVILEPNVQFSTPRRNLPFIPPDRRDTTAYDSIWEYDPGATFEHLFRAAIEGQPPGNFPVIDAVEQESGNNIGVSFKTINFDLHYSGAGGSARLAKTLDAYLQALRRYKKAVLPVSDQMIGILDGCDIRLQRLRLFLGTPRGARAPDLLGVLRDWVAANDRTASLIDETIPVEIVWKTIDMSWNPNSGIVFERWRNARILGEPPGSFPVIDALEKVRELAGPDGPALYTGATVMSAISYKTMNLVHHYHANAVDGSLVPDVDRACKVLVGYLRELRDFAGNSLGNRVVKKTDYVVKRLHVGIPANSPNEFKAAFLAAAQVAVTYSGQTLGINAPAVKIELVIEPVGWAHRRRRK